MVEVVTDEADAAAKDEETVESTDLDVLVRLLGGERARVAEEVDEADGDATVDVEDELQDTSVVGRELTGECTYRVLLRRRHLLDGERVVEQTVAREVLAHVLLHELDTQIRVVDALDLVADTADCVFR